MKQIPLRPVLIGLVILVAAVGLMRIVPSDNAGQVNSAASGSFDGQCTKSNPGVSLVIDFGAESGLTPLIKCVRGFNLPSGSVSNQLNGWQLFAKAGVAVAGTADFAVGFVCRLAGYPSVADQPCTSTPTYSQGHWAYFYAQAGQASLGQWAFSGAGAAMHKPVCGGAEGWLFVKGDQVNGTSANQHPSPQPEVFSCAP